MGKDSNALVAPKKETLEASIAACKRNGERLLEDAQCLEFQEPPSTKMVLSMIAQEEFAKAFFLYLTREDIIPWSRELLRAMHDHSCKQLAGVIIEYLNPEWDTIDDYRRILDAEFELGERLPPQIASAVNLLRHEKMRRWESRSWFWGEDPEYDRTMRAIAEGKRDRAKQDGLYVGIGRDGAVATLPTSVTNAMANAEYALADRYRWFINSLEWSESATSISFDKLKAVLKELFSDPRLVAL